MEPLKEMFGPVYFNKLAGSFKHVYKSFPAEQFLQDVLEPLAALSLNERMRHTSIMPHKHLPKDYIKTKLKELELKPGESIAFKKKQRFQDFTTRKHFPGKHKLEILVNGVVVKRVESYVTP